MAFSRTSLTALAYGNSFTLWHYTSTDAKATVDSANYFANAAELLQVGDTIFVYDSNTPTMTIMQVLSNDGTNVDVSDGTAISMTDTD